MQPPKTSSEQSLLPIETFYTAHSPENPCFLQFWKHNAISYHMISKITCILISFKWIVSVRCLHPFFFITLASSFPMIRHRCGQTRWIMFESHSFWFSNRNYKYFRPLPSYLVVILKVSRQFHQNYTFMTNKTSHYIYKIKESSLLCLMLHHHMTIKIAACSITRKSKYHREIQQLL